MLLAVLYVIIEAGIPQVASETLHNLSVAVMIAAPEIILPGAFVIVRQAKEHGEENRPLLAICWLFVCLTLITLLSLFVLHLDREAISVIMCCRCAAGVGYSVLTRMLSYSGISISHETAASKTQEQPAKLEISPDLIAALREMLRPVQTTITEEAPETRQLLERVPLQDAQLLESEVQVLSNLLPHVSVADITAVVTVYRDGTQRRDVCKQLRWGASKYSTIVKPILDLYDQLQLTA